MVPALDTSRAGTKTPSSPKRTPPMTASDRAEGALKQIGECESRAGMLCRRYYPGDSACTRFGGKASCLEDHRPTVPAAEPAGGTKLVLKVETISDRAKEIEDWLRKVAPEVGEEQKHLDIDSTERKYWHYGYRQALLDILGDSI